MEMFRLLFEPFFLEGVVLWATNFFTVNTVRYDFLEYGIKTKKKNSLKTKVYNYHVKEGTFDRQMTDLNITFAPIKAY